jgi:hypothetical protein
MAYAPDFGQLVQCIANDVHEIFNAAKLAIFRSTCPQVPTDHQRVGGADARFSAHILSPADEVIE